MLIPNPVSITFAVLSAISLYYYPFFEADEINNITVYRRLPSETKSENLIHTKILP